MTTPNPPAFAQGVLELLVRADAREAVGGDLLEEYREARVPALGEWRADLWYWRQVFGIWMRTYWAFVIPPVLLLIVSDVFNTFRAPSGLSYLDGLPTVARLALSPAGAMGFFVIAGAYGSWRTRNFGGGLLAAQGTFVVMWLFMTAWWNVTWYPFAQVQQSNPYWIHAWQWSTQRAHVPQESFLNWIFWDNVGAMLFGGSAMLMASAICGCIGSGVGLISTRRRRA